MFNFAAGFIVCAVLGAAFPSVGVKIHEQAARLVEWGKRLWQGRAP